jgi:hypothetical protein
MQLEVAGCKQAETASFARHVSAATCVRRSETETQRSIAQHADGCHNCIARRITFLRAASAARSCLRTNEGESRKKEREI